MQDQGPWDDCPTGVVTEMAGNLRRRRRRAQLRPFIALGVAVLLVSAIGYGLAGRDKPGSPSVLTCRETVPLLARYHDQSLEAAVASEVREHLSRCPACRKHYAERYPSEVQNSSSAEHQLVAVALQFRR